MNNELSRFFTGYDKVVERLTNIAEQSTKLMPHYPPFNIRKLIEGEYVIELALVGFTKQDIEVEITDNKLTVVGTVKSKHPEDSFIWKGISNKPFTREFTLANDVTVKGAEFTEGMLKIWLEVQPPKSNKKKIDIKDSSVKPAVKTTLSTKSNV